MTLATFHGEIYASV